MDKKSLANNVTKLIVHHLEGKKNESRLYSIVQMKLRPGTTGEGILEELANSPNNKQIRAKFRIALEELISSDISFAQMLERNIGDASENKPKNEINQNIVIVKRGSDLNVQNVMLSAPLIGLKIASDRAKALREWWFNLMRRFQNYTFYGVFLVLPSDIEVIRYLNDFRIELDIISRNNCLLIFLSGNNFIRPDINSDDWKNIIEKHVSFGQSATVAQLFEIDYNKFPCLVLFEDIRSKKHIVVSLKGMSAEEVANRMRTIFTINEKSIAYKRDPLIELQKHRNDENLLQAGKAIIGEIRSLTGKTIETAMEAWVKTMIK